MENKNIIEVDVISFFTFSNGKFEEIGKNLTDVKRNIREKGNVVQALVTPATDLAMQILNEQQNYSSTLCILKDGSVITSNICEIYKYNKFMTTDKIKYKVVGYKRILPFQK